MTDLDKLIAAVEAGTASTMRFEDTLGHISSATFGSADIVAELAYFGSLDAALRLHEALLPGWVVNSLDQASNLAGDPWGCEVAWFEGSNPNNNRRAYSGHNFDKNPARAWLLAILRAIKAKGGS